jgi:hypothetical protein
MLSKILANGIVILAAAELSLLLVVQWWLQVPIAGSTLLSPSVQPPKITLRKRRKANAK